MKKSIEDYDLNNKKVIIRCDLNVPIKDGVILDDNRIKESLKTILYAVNHNAKVIILSHLGRIKKEEDKKKNSLLLVSKRLSKLLSMNVKFIDETRGSVLENAIKNMKPRDIILVQNTRYEDYPEKYESGNDEALGKYWASLGDIFINDAFGTCHRSHASNVGISKYLPSGVGFLVEKEILMLTKYLDYPKRPYTVIMGGAKVSDKIRIIEKLVEKCDYLLLGGGIANTFLKAKGYDLEKSLVDYDSIDFCESIMGKYENKIILPVDFYSAYNYEDTSDKYYSKIDGLKSNTMILDVGKDTINLFKKYIDESKTIFFNGPIGVSEFKNFEYGTKNLCKLLKESGATVIVGGGDSASSAIRFGYSSSFAHISTGGGASLELLEKGSLPAIEIISDRKE